MAEFIDYVDDEPAKYLVAERFVGWLEKQILLEARGDLISDSQVDPEGRFWLGRLGPKDFVTRPDERGDRLEPCAIGLRLKPKNSGPWSFNVRIRCVLWKRERSEAKEHRWRWVKSEQVECSIDVSTTDAIGEEIFGSSEIADALSAAGGTGLTGEVRVRKFGRSRDLRALEVTFVNTSGELDDFCSGRIFECRLEVTGLARKSFELEALPDSFRYDRGVQAYGLNCGFDITAEGIRTSDAPAKSRQRPDYWAADEEAPDLRFATLAKDPASAARSLVAAFEKWADSAWSSRVLGERAKKEAWAEGMIAEADLGALDFREELRRLCDGRDLLQRNKDLRLAFASMNRAMEISARGRYDSWRPFQFAFLLANLRCLVDAKAEADIVDVVWFATGGGKTETYLGLLVTAALLDRMRGKISGITAWSRFPLRMLSLQQTQRFANALAGAEIVRRDLGLKGDPFSLGFLVGSGATPNRILKEGNSDSDDAEKIGEMDNPYRLLETCPFCRERTVTTRFDRRTWRLSHLCSTKDCASNGEPLPFYVVDDEIWRFLPTVVVGTLDKAANIARQSGMRGLVGPPWGLCSKAGHGYTYAKRKNLPNGCLVPDCTGGAPKKLPMSSDLFAPTFRLQDELHLLRDSLGAVDAHYEAALDGIQQELSGFRPKILASSATLTGYKKQIDVLYRRAARVFPQPPPREGHGFWTSDSKRLMRRYIALAPRRLTVEFVVDRLLITLQQAVRQLISEPTAICDALDVSAAYAEFLVQQYGTNVVYGNTLQDIDAVIRSSETQYADLVPTPNVATLTGRTDFEQVRATLDRLERPESDFKDRLHIIAASSMMSHGVDIDRLNIMIMMAFPLGVAEYIQATARVGRKWPALVAVIPKMTRERDASVYRAFPEFISHGDRFVEPIPITRKSRRVLERTISGLEMARLNLVHEPKASASLTTVRAVNAYMREHPDFLKEDKIAIERDLGLSVQDEFMVDQLKLWFEGLNRNLHEPTADMTFPSQLSPSGPPMLSLRDVEEQAPVFGDSTK